MMRYSLVMFFIRVILPIISRLTVYGLENLPPNDASFVGVANHIGRLDPAFVYYMLKRKDIILLVAEKYKEHTWSRILAESVDAIFVDRYNADLNAMREVLRRIKKGGVVVIAPESTRSPTCTLQQGWDGASYIAAKSGLPILPVGVTGSGDKEVVDRLKHLRRLNVVSHVGPLFTLPPLDNKHRDEQLASYTEEIMCRIAAELPEANRGIYADHPRLNELLAEKALRQVQPPRVFG
jgi:1-acyl-sn-glycerol-3-phosphate acyltransferase